MIDSNSEENRGRKSVTAGIFISYLSVGISVIVGVLYTPFIIRSLGRNDYGIYVLSSSLIGMLALDFGLSAASTRFVSRNLVDGDVRAANSVVSAITKLYLLVSLVLTCLGVSLLFFMPSIFVALSQEELRLLRTAFAIILAYTVLMFPLSSINGILTASERYSEMKLVELVGKLITTGLIVMVLLLGNGVVALVSMDVAVSVLIVGVKLWMVIKLTPIRFTWSKIDAREFREVLGFSLWVTVISFMQRLTLNITPSVLGALVGAGAVGAFAPGMTLEGYLYLLVGATGGLFLPRVARLLVSEGPGSTLPLMIRFGRFQLYVTGLVIFGFAILGKEFVRLWLGPDFGSTFVVALLLMSPALLEAPMLIADRVLIMENLVRIKAIAYIVMAVTSFGLNLVLVRSFGEIGAAVAVSGGYWGRSLCLVMIYSRILNLDMRRFFIATYLRPLSVMSIAGFIGGFAGLFVWTDGWLGLLLRGLVFVCVFGLSVWRFAFDSSEKRLASFGLFRLLGVGRG